MPQISLIDALIASLSRTKTYIDIELAKKANSSHGTHLTLGTKAENAYRGDYGNIAYNHSQSAHAPSNAQKNSDITKAEIEAKLTGVIDSHSHPDNIITITKTLAVTENWISTGISGNDLSAGTYVIQLCTNELYCECFSGVMTWYNFDASNINEDVTYNAKLRVMVDTNEIFLHNANNIFGSDQCLFLRTVINENGVSELQISSVFNTSNNIECIFKFKKII